MLVYTGYRVSWFKSGCVSHFAHVIHQRLARLLHDIVMLPFDITRANTPAGVNNLYVEQNHICRTRDGLLACCTEAHGMAFGPSHALY